MSGFDTLGLRVVAIIPARDEAEAIEGVVSALPDWIDRVIVVDNGSRDATAVVARQAGATVVHEPHAGYGAACLAGVAEATEADILLFLDGDGSDDGGEAGRVVAPLVAGEADLVIGSRVLGGAGADTMTLAQRWGNGLASTLLRWIWSRPCTDLGPFRAISATAYRRIEMIDRDYGWTVEMQARAFRHGLKVVEVPVSRGLRRGGVSKITATLAGVLKAGWKILSVIGREAIIDRLQRTAGRDRKRVGADPGETTPTSPPVPRNAAGHSRPR